MATSSNAFLDEQAVAEMALCTDLFDHIDDLLSFPGDDIVDDSDVPTRSRVAVSDAITTPFPHHPTDHDIDAPLFGGHSSAASDDQLLDATALNQDDHTKLGSCDDVELAELDWLSNFLDDSSESFALHLPTVPAANASKNKKTTTTSSSENGDKGGAVLDTLFRTPSPVSVLEPSSLRGGRGGVSQASSTSPTSSSSSSSSFIFGENANFRQFASPPVNCPHPPPPETLIIPGRARTKRPRPAAFFPRTAVQPQAVVIPNLTPAIEPEAVPLSAITTATISNDPESFGEHDPAPEATIIKKKKKKPSSKNPLSFLHGGPFWEDEAAVSAATGAPPVRKCMHCEITKTPQWRAGPMGPKTLCNACGVRYKSGRLFPEYRPAASPTFVSSVHSNSHKKVVEMRINASQKAAAAGMSVPDNPAAKGCDLLQFIRRREQH